MKRICLLFFMCSQFLNAQIPKSLDSLKAYLETKKKDTNYVVALNEYAFLIIREGEFKEAVDLIQKMEDLSTKLNYGLGFYYVQNMSGVVEYSKQNSKKALSYFINANKIIERYKLTKKINQNSLNNIGIIYSQMGDRKNATKYAVELMNFQEKNKLRPYKSWPYTQLGDNLKFYKKPEEALIYYKKALNNEILKKDISGIAIGENRIGTLYEDLGNNKEAIACFKRGLVYAKKADYKLLEGELLINLGRLYNHENNYKDAEIYLKRAEKYNEELGAVNSLKIVYSNLGQLYLSQKKYDLAQKYSLKALKLANEILDPESSFTANEHLSYLYEAKGDFKKAYEYKVTAGIWKDSINKIEVLENTEDLLRKYETEKKEQQIEVLSVQNKVKNLQIENSKRQTWYFISGLAFLSIFGALLYFQNRNRKRTNEKLQLLNSELDEANKAKTRFFSILNHDLRGPVANLIWFLQMQKDNPELMDEESKNRIQDKTISGVENLLVSMEDMLQWSKSQMENFKPQPTSLLINQLFSDIQLHFSSEEKIELFFEDEERLEIISDENYLKTIMRNLTGNAINALEKSEIPTIIWKAWQEKDKVFLSISDNGSGVTNEQLKAFYNENESVGIKTGLGLHLIRDLSKAIDCKIIVESDLENGTTFTMQLNSKK